MPAHERLCGQEAEHDGQEDERPVGQADARALRSVGEHSAAVLAWAIEEDLARVGLRVWDQDGCSVLRLGLGLKKPGGTRAEERDVWGAELPSVARWRCGRAGVSSGGGGAVR